jgi:hypothetical protein
MASVTEFRRDVELTDDRLDEIIDELYPSVTIAGSFFYASDILREQDPDAYEQFRADNVDEETCYSCDECGYEYDNEFDAECCCDDEDEEDEED